MSETPDDQHNVVPIGKRKADRAGRAAAAAAGGAPRSAKVEAEKAAELSQKDKLAKIIGEAQLWHDSDFNAYATVTVDRHEEHGLVRSAWFRRWLVGRYGDEYPAVVDGIPRPSSPSTTALSETLLAVEAAACRGPLCTPALRVAGNDQAVYVDLASPSWEAIEVTASGWRIVSTPPVKFLRPKGMRELPRPCAGGSLADLATLLGFGAPKPPSEQDDQADAFMLLVGWAVAALSPIGPYPILFVAGEQGSGKSTVTAWLKQLVDPGLAERRSAPADLRDLMIAAKNSYVLNFDNLSGVDNAMADSLARLSTGAAFSTRMMYENDEELIIALARPVLGNGIPDLATRADLADRAIAIRLSSRADEARRDERSLAIDFEVARPRILAALLDGVASALANLDDIREAITHSGQPLPRMLDAAIWLEAAAVGFGWKGWSWLKAYNRNRTEAAEVALEADPIVPALVETLAKMPATYEAAGWSGSATELLAKMNETAGERQQKAKAWPKTAAHLSALLSRVAPGLRLKRIDMTKTRPSGGSSNDQRPKVWTIKRIKTAPDGEPKQG